MHSTWHIGLWKTEVAPFTDKQIELLTSLADQAVIAIENVRLFDGSWLTLETNCDLCSLASASCRFYPGFQPADR
jgi:GAF domain-containing protein